MAPPRSKQRVHSHVSKGAKLTHKAERAARFKRGKPVEQFPSAFPDAPELAAGIGRTLSRGLP